MMTTGDYTLTNNVTVGTAYIMKHFRKGTATVKVLAVSGEWIDVEVIEGRLKGMGAGSLCVPGDTERVRDCLATFTDIPANHG